MALIGLKQLDSVLTGSLQVSGSAAVTGSLKVVTGNIELVEDQRIYFEADKGTWIESNNADALRLVAGGQTMLTLDQDSPGKRATFGNGTKVYIGANNNAIPTKELEVVGDVSASGDLIVNNISASGDIIGPTDDNFDIKSDKDVRLYLDKDNDGSFHKFQVFNEDGDVKFAIASDGKSSIGAAVTSTSLDGLSVTGGITATGHITGSGNISGSATSTGSFGKVEVDRVDASDGFYHSLDADEETYIKFPTGDKIDIVAGGVNFIYAWQKDADVNKLIFNEDNTDTDIVFRSANGSNNKLLYLDASADKVGIRGNGFPAEALTVEGNVSASGDFLGTSTSTGSFGTLETSGIITGSDIYSSGRIYEQGSSVIDHATAMAIVFGG